MRPLPPRERRGLESQNHLFPFKLQATKAEDGPLSLPVTDHPQGLGITSHFHTGQVKTGRCLCPSDPEISRARGGCRHLCTGSAAFVSSDTSICCFKTRAEAQTRPPWANRSLDLVATHRQALNTLQWIATPILHVQNAALLSIKPFLTFSLSL